MALIGSIKKNEKKSIIKRKYEIRTQNKIIVKIKLVANRFEYELRNRKQNKIIVKIKSIANRFVIRITKYEHKMKSSLKSNRLQIEMN